MAYIRRFILMLQFMTSIPINANVKAEREDFGKGLATAPMVGLVIGALLAVANLLLKSLFPVSVASVITIALYAALTGGLHIDGLGDTADGLFSNRSREKILEIMKDSRVGTNAVLTVIIVLLINISLISTFGNQTFAILLLMPVAGRIGSLIGSGTSHYAGISDGPGRWCVECCGKNDIIAGLSVYLGIFAAVAAINGFLSLGIPIMLVYMASALIPPISAGLLTWYFSRKLGGVTGDILGAVCELNQVVFLMSMHLLLKLL